MAAVPRHENTSLLWHVAIAAVCVAIGGLGGALASHRDASLDPFVGAVVGMSAGAMGAACLLALEPALILTGALILSIFSGNWGHMGIPIPLDRVAVACGIATALIRSWQSGERPQTRPIQWLMLLLLLDAIVSAAWAGTLTEHAPLFALVDRLGMVPFALFLLAPVAFRTEEQRRILAAGLVVVGIYLSLISLFEAVHSLNGLVVPKYILNPALGNAPNRSRGPFLEPGANGLAMFNCMAAGAIILARWRVSRGGRAVVLAMMIMCAVGLVLTVTRQVWVGAAVGAGVAMLSNRQLRGWLPFAAVGAAIVVFAALAFVPGLRANANQRANDQGSVYQRLSSDGAALRMFEARPALGFGWGGFAADATPYYRLAATYPTMAIDIAHNMALSNAAELGLVGVGLWIVIMLMGLVAPTLGRAPPEVEPWRLALIAVAIAWFVQSNLSPLDYAFDNYIVWLWAGIVVGGRARADALSGQPVRIAAHSLHVASPRNAREAMT
jgi:putative inorganic carbon (HCO3(-)) transporter